MQIKRTGWLFLSWSYLLVLLPLQWKARKLKRDMFMGNGKCNTTSLVDKIRWLETFLQLLSCFNTSFNFSSSQLHSKATIFNICKALQQTWQCKFRESTVSYTVYKFYIVNYACWALTLAPDSLLKTRISKLAV